MLIVITIIHYSADAKDFGKFGNTFEVKEEGFLKMIHRRLKSVDLENEQKKIKILVRKKVEEPEAVKGIMPATKDNEYIYDPTYIVEKDIFLPNGHILYKAGTKINPLEKMSFDRKLYFIDQRIDDQVKWLKTELSKSSIQIKNDANKNVETRVILVGGRPLELAEELNIQIYFDQFGELTNKFQIKFVPAVIEQEDKYLRIKEIAIN